jgi:hypothetical protein
MPRPTAPSVAAADLDARCLDLRRSGATYRQIGQQLGISPANAHKRVTRGLDRTRREPADALRELELERLDRLQVEATEVLAANHVVIQAGKVVVDKQGEPCRDHGPTVAAIRTLVQVQESRRKLLGLDTPAKVDARVLTIDQIDAQIAELEALLGETADREDVDLYQRNHQQAAKLVEGLAEQAGVDYHERRQVHDQVLAFWNAWKNNQRAVRDVSGFIAASLEMAIMLVALPADEEEALAAGVERFLEERVR